MKKKNLTEMLQAARERHGGYYLCAYINAYCDNQDEGRGRKNDERNKKD
jgi:hypothetical protein